MTINLKELDRLRAFPPDSEERFAFIVAVWMEWPELSRALKAAKHEVELDGDNLLVSNELRAAMGDIEL